MRLAITFAAAAVAVVMTPAAASPVRAASPGYTVQAGTFHATNLGPRHDTACDIAYDLYTPDPVPAPGTAPAILFTNGFGGSKKDGANMAKFFAPQGYVVLSYSGLGFGGSGCQIELDSPEWDGQAASQIIDYLGTLPAVKKDAPGDPRVGMIGGSYGGAIQLATASVTSKLDTIIPQITWHDLAYSLAPSNDSSALAWTDNPPGVPKVEWTSLFFAEGLSEPLQNQQIGALQTTLVGGCPGFDATVCPDNVKAAATGAPDAQTAAFLRHASMTDYGSRVRIPTMLMQGEGDTLFNIDEAVANRAQIMANGAYVKLVLQSWGHSFSNDPTDNTDFADPAHPTYEERLVQRWFDHYLKGLAVDTGPPIEYFRDWAYNASADAQPAYGSAPSWPLAPAQSLGLSGASDLVPLGTATSAGLRPASQSGVAAGSQTFLSAPSPSVSSYSETSAVQYTPGLPFTNIPATDPPGMSASWTTAPLSANVDIAGIPSLTFNVSAAMPALAGLPGTMPVLFGKLYDVAPDNTTSLLFPRLVAPIRIADLSRPVTMTLPGVVHRFAAGHSIRLVLAATDYAYLNSRLPNSYTVSTSPDSPSVLSLPVLSGAAALTPPQAAATPPGAAAPPAGASLASSSPGLTNTAASGAPPAAPALGFGALLTLVTGGAIRRRRITTT